MSDRALIIIHGLFGSGRNWRAVAEQLSKTLPVYTVDLPNHGATFMKHGNEDMSWSGLSEQLGDFLEGLNIPKISLMGHSLGGQVVMQSKFLKNQRFERLVDRMIIVDVAPKPLSFIESQIGKLLDRLIELEAAKLPNREVARKFIEEIEPNPNVVQFLLSNATIKSGQVKFVIPLEQLRNSMISLQKSYNSVEKTNSITTPTWFLRGEKSNFISLPEDEQLIANLFTNYQLITIKDSGHWPHFDQTKAFLEIVNKILS